MINLARKNGGVLNAEDAKNYLQKTMLSYGSIGQLLQLNSSDTFLYYDANRYLLTEKIGINKELIQMIHKCKTIHIFLLSADSNRLYFTISAANLN